MLPVRSTAATNIRLESAGVVRVETDEVETITRLQSTSGSDLAVGRRVYRARVQDDIDDFAYLEGRARVDGGLHLSRSAAELALNDVGWETIEAPFYTRQGTVPEEVVLYLVIRGPGRSGSPGSNATTHPAS